MKNRASHVQGRRDMDCLAANLNYDSIRFIERYRYCSLSHIYQVPTSFDSGLRCNSFSTPDLLHRDENLVKRTSNLRDLCQGHVRDHIISRIEEVGFVVPTDVQSQALPVLFSGRDVVLHAQTGSGKTLAYMLLIFALVDEQRSSVQALIVVPTRELGIQVTKVARTLVAKPLPGSSKSCSVMSLLDGGLLKRQKGWIKVEPPTIVVATINSLCRMVEKGIFNLKMIRVLIVDEVDFMFSSSNEAASLRKLLGSGSFSPDRQTVFASASIPQHKQFIRNCVQQKWTKRDVVHVHVNPVEPMPSRLHHRFLICEKEKRLDALLSLIQSDDPESGIVFVNEKLETATHVVDFLNSSYKGGLTIHHLYDDMNFNRRATSLYEVRQGGGRLLVATDIAARGVDLPEVTHIYNFDLPRTAVEYLHRAGRTGRRPFSDNICVVTTILPNCERFVLQRYQNELIFHCEHVFV